MVMFLVVGVGLAVAVVLLVLALREGRHRPRHAALWWVGFVLLALDTVFHIPLAVGSVIAGGLAAAWLIIGALAFGAALWLAFIRPDWAGWALIGTAVGLPLILIVGSAIAPADPEGVTPWQVMLAFYTLPALVMGTLLVLSMKEFGQDAATSESPTAQRDVTSGVHPSHAADR